MEKITYNREYGRNRYNNISEEDKQRLKEYQKNYRLNKQYNYFICTFFYCIKWNQKS